MLEQKSRARSVEAIAEPKRVVVTGGPGGEPAGAAERRSPLLVRLGPYVVDVPMAYRADMRVPARIYADATLMEGIAAGRAIDQLVNVATLPGIVDYAYGMPDMHEGYGFPVGGVAATLLPDGVVSPGGVGFDINCGVRLLALPLTREALGEQSVALTHEFSRCIPVGPGREGERRLSDAELDGILQDGAAFAVNALGCGFAADLTHTESHGRLPDAAADAVSARAKDRGRGQLGTLGAGNHFVELQVLDEVFDESAARALGLTVGQVTVLIHSGSRGLGHQVCTDYVRLFDARLAAFGIVLPDRQLSCAPASSNEGRAYLRAMAAAANFAFANRQTLTHRLRGAIRRVVPTVDPHEIRVVYDVAHNIAKAETHGGRALCVHRKGATRALGPGHPELPPEYRGVGQPVFVPGSMGTSSMVMVGAHDAEGRSFSSACHGAGRRLSRGGSKREITGAAVRHQLEERGITVRCPSSAGLAEEAPLAYKDVDQVVRVVEGAGLARRVARLRPIGVIKG